MLKYLYDTAEYELYDNEEIIDNNNNYEFNSLFYFIEKIFDIYFLINF